MSPTGSSRWPLVGGPAGPRLFGRDEDRALLTAWLRDDRPGIISVTGPSGVGKTALVDVVRADAADLFPGGTVLLSGQDGPHPRGWPFPALSISGSAAPIPAGTSGPYRGRESAGVPTVPIEPAGLLADRRLLIADPADDLVTALGELATRLPATSRIVACAIRPLGVPGERVVRLGPLPAADPDEEADMLASDPGVRLFRAAATAVGAGHGTAGDLAAIARVCRQLGGWPLALEGAATRMRLVRPEVLAKLLAEEPGLAFEPAADPRNPTRLMPSLRAAFDRTWLRLTPSERTVLRAAAQFAGSFDVPQLAAVAALPVASALDTLGQLIDLGLVHVARPGPDRFALSAPVRQYARWTFGRTAPERPLRRRYVDLVCRAAGASAAANDRGDERGALRAIGGVTDELLPVLDHLLASGTTESALRLAGDLAPGMVQSGRFDFLADRLDALLRRPDVAPGRALATALVGYADMVFTGTRGPDWHELAAERLWRGVEMTRRFGDPPTQLRALSVVVGAWPVMRDVDVGARCVKEGLRLAREAGSPRWLARFEAWSGMLAHQIGDLPSAVALGTAALARGRRCGDLRARLLAGILLHTVPDPPTDVPGGLPRLTDLLAMAEALGDPRLGSIVLAYVARSRLIDGDRAEAAYWCARALEEGGRLDTWFGAGFAIMFLVDIACHRGTPEQAALLHGMVADRMDELSANLPPHAAADYAAAVATLRATLDADTFNARARTGSTLAWRDATAAALSYAYRAGAPVRDAGEPADPTMSSAREVARRTRDPDRTANGGARATELTPREWQVLRLIAQGLDTRTIATQLRISAHATSHHTSNILSKLGVENRTQAAIWAVRREPADGARTGTPDSPALRSKPPDARRGA